MSSSRVVELEFLGFPLYEAPPTMTEEDQIPVNKNCCDSLDTRGRSYHEHEAPGRVKRSVKHIDDQLKSFAVRLGADESLNIP